MLLDTFNSLPGLNKKYVLAVWKHSLFCAGLIRVIAKEASQDVHEEMFLAAMVHNIGHLVLSQHFGSKYDELIKTNIFPSVEEEARYLKVNHAEIGSVLLGRWKFSDEIINIVNAHHQAELFEGEKKKIWYLQLCDLVARNDGEIEEYFEKVEFELSAQLIEILKNANWTWSCLKENREVFNQIFESVNQAIPQKLK
jgi:HD-like signal output (HDOD) protein